MTGLAIYFAFLISGWFWILIELSSIKDELRKIRTIKEKEVENGR
jgi:hypothetical protein